ncbi:hypothetical protein [Hymenobacter lucidus]|uniref:Uncharacterized protein n=1 Tax=Hymenobacter lucidus TaxID=2880930 RepID=A0ABS8AXS9_9BACT|nr:hypothetical protein [Hymenobacter lucidus]MCB2410592.1 hypothetical protein [Hymenobacter lucidus]
MLKRSLWMGSIVAVVAAGFYGTAKFRNPYTEVEWLEDMPGATDRYVTFTPVLRSNPKVKLGPAVGADYAKLYFEDVDNDGSKEAIIETDGTFTLEEFHPERHILRYQPHASGNSQFVLVKSEVLPHLPH